MRWCGLVAAGIGVQGHLGVPLATWTAAAAALGLAVAAGAARGRRMAPVALLLVVVCGAWWLAAHEARLDAGLKPYVDIGPVVLTGRVAGFPERDGDRLYAVVQADRIERQGTAWAAHGRVRVTLPPGVEVAYGDIIQVRAVLRRPPAAGNPGSFDYREHLRRQGVTAVADVSYPRHVSIVDRGRAPLVQRLAAAARDAVSRGLTDVLTPERAGVMLGLVLGQRQELPQELEEAFRRAGVMHLLAVSGLHVGFVAAAAWRLVSALRVPRALGAAAAAALVWVYVLATGARPPAVRAGVATTLSLAAACVGRERDLGTALALAALGLLIHNPLVLYDVSFQLTFAATIGIWAAYSPVRRRLSRLPAPVAQAVAVAAGAQLGVAPLLAYYFQELSLVGFAGSLAGGPLAGLLVPLGLTTGLAYHVWPSAARLLGIGTSLVLDGLVAVTTALARIPGVLVTMPRPWPGTLLVAWALSFVVVRWADLAPRLRRAALLACGLVVAAGWWAWLVAPRPLVAVFLDVGQGDAVLIRTPAGVTALVDGGGYRMRDGVEIFNAGRDVIVPYLRREGVRRVDAVILTHPHDDHLAGLVALVDSLPVGVAIDNGRPGATPSWERYTELLAEKGVPRRAVRAGDLIRLDADTVLEVLHPPRSPEGSSDSLNDDSLVLRLRYGTTALLLTGDLEVAGQLQLLAGGWDLRADAVKVPHHGSRLSLVSALYEAARPAAAVISVGANNYGQPHPDVVATLSQMGIAVYRTDRHGAVRWESDGTHWRLCPARFVVEELPAAC